MQLVIHPPVEEQRLARIVAAAGSMRVVNAADADTARTAMPAADAFFGKLTPELLAAATNCAGCNRPRRAWSITCFPS